MITLVGVGHVMDITNQIHSVVSQRQPDAVCIELDRARYLALRNSVKGGSAPVAYRMLAGFQKDLARKYGTEVGGEMLAAIDAAKLHNAKIFGIDMDARTMWNKMWQGLTFWQRLKILFSSIAGLFTPRQMIEDELDAFQENSEEYLEMIQQEFPAIKEILIDERNRYMVNNIRRIREKYPNVIAFVGDAHVPGMARQLGGELEVIRLKELREMSRSTNASVSFSLEGR